MPVGLVPSPGDALKAIPTILKASEFPVVAKDGVIEPADAWTNSSSASLQLVSAVSRMKPAPGVTEVMVLARIPEPSPIMLATIKSLFCVVVIAALHFTVVLWFEQVPSPGVVVATPEYSWTAPCQSVTPEEKVTVICRTPAATPGT